MRQGPNGRRPPRGRHHGGSNNSNHGNGGGGGNHGGGMPGRDNRPRSASSLRHQSFDSNCGDLRVRGNAWQVHEKYQALARDATSSGDRVTAENYLQHAEHYFRIIEPINEATASEQRARGEPVTPPSPFGAQPETPNHYYGGSPVPNPSGNTADQSQPQQQPMAEATVQPVNQPQPSPFFTQEEIEEHKREQSLVAAR